MVAEAAAGSSAAAVMLVLVLVVVPVLALLARRALRRAAARREEVRRLARQAAEESELAERESVRAFYSDLFPGVVHAAQVMDFVGVTEIPKNHILKRWTRDARDVLPLHLRHYQNNRLKGQEVTYRHSNLYILAMEPVRLGDSSVEAY